MTNQRSVVGENASPGPESPAEPAFTRLAILGLGLIGGSLALASEARALAQTVVAYDPDVRQIAEASARGIIEQGYSSARDAVADADAVLLAAPVRAIIGLLGRIGPVLAEDCFVMDLGSTKGEIVAAMAQLPPTVHAVGGHPMAGKEITGFAAAEPTLFVGAPFALCATARTTPRARALAEGLVIALGARPLWLDAEAHDDAVARVSHLPYLAAAALATAVAPADVARALASTGYRDTSRLAHSDATMMLDILRTNREPIRDALGRLRGALDELDSLLAGKDEEQLRRWLDRARERR